MAASATDTAVPWPRPAHYTQGPGAASSGPGGSYPDLRIPTGSVTTRTRRKDPPVRTLRRHCTPFKMLTERSNERLCFLFGSTLLVQGTLPSFSVAFSKLLTVTQASGSLRPCQARETSEARVSRGYTLLSPSYSVYTRDILLLTQAEEPGPATVFFIMMCPARPSSRRVEDHTCC